MNICWLRHKRNISVLLSDIGEVLLSLPINYCTLSAEEEEFPLF